MPSTLPVIRIRTNDENVIKLKTIARYNQRSVSREVERLIEKHIAEFESKHGEIEIYTMGIDEAVQDLKDRISKKPPYGDNK